MASVIAAGTTSPSLSPDELLPEDSGLCFSDVVANVTFSIPC